MSCLILLIVASLGFFFGEVESDDSSEEAYPNYQYMQIFNGVPALFEYLLNAVEENPEILEKNDVALFKRRINIMSKDENDENTSDSGEEEKHNKRNADHETAPLFREPASTAAYEYGNSIIMNTNARDTYTTDTTKDSVRKKIKIIKNKVNRNIQKRNIKNDEKTTLDFSDLGFEDAWDEKNGYSAFQQLFRLDITPEEIQDSIFLTEKVLEEYEQKYSREKNK